MLKHVGFEGSANQKKRLRRLIAEDYATLEFSDFKWLRVQGRGSYDVVEQRWIRFLKTNKPMLLWEQIVDRNTRIVGALAEA